MALREWNVHSKQRWAQVQRQENHRTVHLKVIKMVNYMLYIFYYNKKI